MGRGTHSHTLCDRLCDMKQLADWLSNDISKYTSYDNNSNSNSCDASKLS